MTSRLRVATYNLHGCVGTDGRREVERIASVIRDLDADVVGLQEVDCRGARGCSDQLAELSEATGLVSISGPTMESDDGFYGNALLSRWPVRRTYKVDISVDGREPRGLLEAVIEHEAVAFTFVVTHFGLHHRERRHQSECLVERLRDKRPVVVVGDFNEWRPRGLTLVRLHRALGRAPRVRSFPSRLPLLALDRIWARPHTALRDVHTARSPLAKSASDHLPVMAELDVAAMSAPIS